MRKLFLFEIFSLSLLVASSQGKRDIIIDYNPVQSGVVGKTLISYSNGQALFGNTIPDLQTKDESSSSDQTLEFNKRFAFGIANILKGEAIKNISSHAFNVKVTNMVNDVQTIPTGSKIIMSGLKADSVIITVTKKSGYRLSLNDLLDKIKNFAPVNGGSALNVISLVDSANYNGTKTVQIIIKNPSVVYAIMVGQVTQEYAGNAWLDFKNAIGNSNLNLNIVTDRVTPKYSDDFGKIGFGRSFLIRTSSDNNQPKLYLQATKQEGGVDEVLIPKTGNNYSATGLLFNSIVLGKVTKKYYVDIAAHLSDDNKTIIIDRAEIRYPEWVLDAVQRRYL